MQTMMCYAEGRLKKKMAAENEGFALNYEDEEEAGGQQNGAPQQEEAPRYDRHIAIGI